ncbi:hypothetical protein EYV94_25720 [Puteibacter caeruleilacunae]|nr:hypothetical protein EYV94_25720 [Puteibacter caeruleilacunae]
MCLNIEKMKSLKNLIVLLMCVGLMITLSQSAHAILPEKMESFWVNSLNGDWKFKFEKGSCTVNAKAVFNGEIAVAEWDNISVPSNWEMHGFGTLEYKFPKSDETGWYYREFEVPENWKETNRKMRLYFEGVAYGFEVWLNGKRIGDFESAFNRAEFDIQNYIRKNEKNKILVRVYGNHEHVGFDCSDSWSLHGIFRDVYLYAAPQVHYDKVVITTPEQGQNAEINIVSDIHSFHLKDGPLKDVTQEVVLKYNGEVIKTIEQAVLWQGKHYMPLPLNTSFKLNDAKLWNAETPNLYELVQTLKQGEEVLHSISSKVGIREISIENSQLLVNGSPIKLRGVNRHEMHPERGRAVSEADMRLDLEKMKQANINTIRCSHYPPHPRFFELCDEYGFYVIDEIPLGFDEYSQKIPGNLGTMLARVNHTVNRDINHPSVLIWSVGNENPICTNWIKMYEYCKMLDPTRPALYSGNNFHGYMNGMPVNTDMFADHYPSTEEIIEHRDDEHIQAPIIYTEYNHALDKALYDLEERWNIMQNSRKHAGGCIWDWVDQELLRSVKKGAKVYDTRAKDFKYPVNGSALIANRWKNDSTILDCHGAYGNDGLVDGYRNPSVSYFEVQAVYCPVKFREDKIGVAENESPAVEIQNNYDFIDLSGHKCIWKWYSNNKLQKEGTLELTALPHTKQKVQFPFALKKALAENVNIIELSVVDHKQRNIRNKTIEIVTEGSVAENGDSKLINDGEYKSIPAQSSIKLASNQTLRFDENGKFQFYLGSALMVEGPILKTGRNADNTTKWLTYYSKKKKRSVPTIYPDVFADNYRLVSQKWYQNNMSTKVELLYAFKLKNEDAEVQLHLNISVQESGQVDFEYQLKEAAVSAKFLELGLGLKMPDRLENIAWLGDGPYPQYPKKASSGNFNYHKMKIDDSNFEGNHTNVSAIVVSNNKKTGVGIVAKNQNWGMTALQDSYVLSNNLFVANRVKKGSVPSLTGLDKKPKGSFSFFLSGNKKLLKQFPGLL